MTGQGFPDFRGDAVAVGALLLNDANRHAGAGVVYPVIDVSVWAALLFHMEWTVAASAGYVRFDWYLDAAATVLMGTSSYSIENPAAADDQVANLGPFLVITITPLVAAPGDVYTLRVVPMYTLDARARRTPSAFTGWVLNAAIGAGGDLVTLCAAVITGPHLFHASSLAGTDHVASVVQQTGAVPGLVIATLDNRGVGRSYGGQAVIYLTPDMYNIHVHNVGAGLDTFDASLIPLT